MSPNNLRELADFAKSRIQNVVSSLQTTTTDSEPESTFQRLRRHACQSIQPIPDRNGVAHSTVMAKRRDSSRPSDHHSMDTSSPTNTNVTQVVQQVIQTLFAPCVNFTSSHPASQHTSPAKYEQSSALHHTKFLYAKNTMEECEEEEELDEEERYYAQFFAPPEDGQAARAILLARQQEEQNRQWKDSFATGYPGKNMTLAVAPMAATHLPIPTVFHATTQNHSQDPSDDIFDDGISALSAHTLEDMARLQMRLQQALSLKSAGECGVHVKATFVDGKKTLTRDGYDLEDPEDERNPPSPASTESSEKSSDRERSRSSRQDIRTRNTTQQNGNHNKSTKTMVESKQQQRISKKDSSSFDEWFQVGNDSNLEMTHLFPSEQQQQQQRSLKYVDMQPSKAATHPKPTQENSGSSKIKTLNNSTTTSTTSLSSQFIHPHETLAISVQDVIGSKGKKKGNGLTRSSRKLDYHSNHTDVGEI